MPRLATLLPRLAAGVIALGLLAAAGSPAGPARDWSRTTRQTAKGAYVIGNPSAPVSLVEYGSYTCSHCAAFAKASEPVLKARMIASGRLSFEYRHLIRDPMDLGAAILARCTGAARFAATSATIFATQDGWLPRVAAYAQSHPELDKQPLLAQARALANASGLVDVVRRGGSTPAAINACFANRAEIDRITAMTADAPVEVRSTPTFLIDSQIQPPMGWAELEPILRARIASATK